MSRKTWGITAGMPYLRLNDDRVPLREMLQRLPELGGSHLDLQGWSADEKIIDEPGLPMQIGLDVSFPVTQIHSPVFRRSNLRLALLTGVADNSYSDNLQKIDLDPMKTDVINRDVLYLYGITHFFTAQSSLNCQTRALGRKKRTVLGIGLALMGSNISSTYYLEALSGTYLASMQKSEVHFWNSYPGQISATRTNLGSSKVDLFAIGWGIPFSLEWLLTKNQNLHLGFEQYLGYHYSIDSSYKWIYQNYGLQFYLRFDFGKVAPLN